MRHLPTKILHIANWYPNPWDNIEGNFVRDQIRVFKQEIPAETIVVQVRFDNGGRPRLKPLALDDDARGYFLLAPVKPGKVMEWLSTLLLIGVLFKERAWRFDALHFHIAYPLLLHSRLWAWLFRKPIVISEHWSAYHYNFYLPEKARALRTLRKPFRQGYPVFAVSEALLNDIRAFAQVDDFAGFVVPNFVPLHGNSWAKLDTPTLFAVNRWRQIKNPMPMLEGLNKAVLEGQNFRLVIGGFGDSIREMIAFVEKSALCTRTIFAGKMSKPDIAGQLAQSDGYLFSSDHETFSIACAEAMGAGVPLIGPYLSAIAEYAGSEDWIEVTVRTAEGWQDAIQRFIEKWNNDQWDRNAIAQRAAERFSETELCARYRAAMQALRIGNSQ